MKTRSENNRRKVAKYSYKHHLNSSRFPDDAQQVLESYFTAISFSFSVVQQEVFLRHAAWQRLLRGEIDENDVSFGGSVPMLNSWSKDHRFAQNTAVTASNDRFAFYEQQTVVGQLLQPHDSVVLYLLSNRTDSDVVNALTSKILMEHDHVVVVEEVIGNARQALGFNCGGSAASPNCLRPIYASHLSEILGFKRNVDVVWKRHSNAYNPFPRSDSVSCREAVASLSGAGNENQRLLKSCRLVDLRFPDDTHFLDGYVRDKAPVSKCANRISDMYGIAADTSPELWFNVLLEAYADFHSTNPDGNTLVYVCLPFSQCGGHGDRINGILTLFLLAVATKRRFLILSSNPVDLEVVFATHRIDWRMNIEDVSLSFTRSYIDRRQQCGFVVLQNFEVLGLRTNRMLKTPNQMQFMFCVICDEHATNPFSKI